MAETNETIADIIAEKRREANYIVQVSQGKCQTRRDKAEDEARDIRREADRIEAAHKREVQNALDAGGFVEASRKNKQVGNAAKLREAIDYLCERMADMDATFDPSEVECLRAALAAPPRNCDIGTTTEQSDRMRHFCLYDQGGCGGCSRRNKGMTFRECVIDWGQMPYEAKEGGAK